MLYKVLLLPSAERPLQSQERGGTDSRYGHHERRFARHHIEIFVGLDYPLDARDGEDGSAWSLLRQGLALLDDPLLLLFGRCSSIPVALDRIYLYVGSSGDLDVRWEMY